MPRILDRTYKIAAKGVRGLTVQLPRDWCEHHDLGPGDRMAVYRDPDHPERLIYEPAGLLIRDES